MTYTPSGMEKGHAPFDIGQILTRHATSGEHPCARVLELRRSAHSGNEKAEQRLKEALATVCTCGVGDSPAERTSVDKKMDVAP